MPQNGPILCSNRKKGIKKTSFGLTGKFTIKKFEIYLRALFFYKTFLLFAFFKSPRDEALFISGF